LESLLVDVLPVLRGACLLEKLTSVKVTVIKSFVVFEVSCDWVIYQDKNLLWSTACMACYPLYLAQLIVCLFSQAIELVWDL
jgi:hypothetical protein